MPHERIYGVPMTYEDPNGKIGWSGTGVLDVYWGKDDQSLSFGLSLQEEGTTEQPGQIRPMPEGQAVPIGSWTQVNRLLRVLKRARDDAYGTPE